jgi:hypothetical protein
VFAPAKIHGLCFGGIKFCGIKFRPFMRAITKRLILAMTTGTPVVAFAFFDANRVRSFLSNMWFHHPPLVSVKNEVYQKAI